MPKKDDVYIKAMSEESFTKISLHESGQWLHQIVTEREDHPQVHWVTQPDPESRVLDSWQRPAAIDGWVHAITLFMRSEDIVHVPDDLVRPSAVGRWITAAPAGECSEFGVFLIESSAPRRAVPTHRLATSALTIVGAYQLAGGEFVMVTHRRTTWTANEKFRFATASAEHRRSFPSDFNADPATGPRAVMGVAYEDGHRAYVDAAIVL